MIINKRFNEIGVLSKLSIYVLCELEGDNPIENNQTILFDESKGKAESIKI